MKKTTSRQGFKKTPAPMNEQFQGNTEAEDTMLQAAAMTEHFGTNLTKQFQAVFVVR